MQLLFSFDRGTRVKKILMQTLASQLSSILMQLLLSFTEKTKKTLMQTLACQLSSTLMQLLLSFTEKTKNSHANSRFSTLINSHATLALFYRENSHANSRLILNSFSCYQRLTDKTILLNKVCFYFSVFIEQ